MTLLALPFSTDLTVLGGAYRGRYRPVPSVVASFLIQPTLRVAAVLALCLWTSRLWAAVDGTLVSFAAAWLCLAWWARRASSPASRAASTPSGSCWRWRVSARGWICSVEPCHREKDGVTRDVTRSKTGLGNSSIEMFYCKNPVLFDGARKFIIGRRSFSSYYYPS